VDETYIGRLEGVPKKAGGDPQGLQTQSRMTG
jgi:hypothetical protein